jgi:hypothetical protein
MVEGSVEDERSSIAGQGDRGKGSKRGKGRYKYNDR